MADVEELTERYVGMWNEPDVARRAAAVRDVWAPGGTHVVRAPVEVRAAVEAIGFVVPGLRAAGYEALEFRVGRAYDEFVAPGVYFFRSAGDVARLDDVVTFRWEMVARADGVVTATGLEVLVLDGDGKVARDYQFVE